MTTGSSIIAYVRSLAAFKMARLNVPPYLTQHGMRHVERVCEYLEQLLEVFQMPEEMKFRLRIAALLHDIGQTKAGASYAEVRKNHHLYGRDDVFQLHRDSKLPLRNEQVEDVAELVFRHNLETSLPEGRLRLPCLLLRIADVMDLTAERAAFNDFGMSSEQIREEYEFSQPVDWTHFASHLAVDHLATSYDQTLNLLTFTFTVNDPECAAFQVERFRKKIQCLEEFVNVGVYVVCFDEAESGYLEVHA